MNLRDENMLITRSKKFSRLNVSMSSWINSMSRFSAFE